MFCRSQFIVLYFFFWPLCCLFFFDIRILITPLVSSNYFWTRTSPYNKLRTTKHTYKTKDRVTRTPLKTGGELRCSRRVSSSCSTSDTHRVNLVTNPVISHEWGKDREVFTTSGTYPWSFVPHIFHIGQPSHCGDRKSDDFNLTKMKPLVQ
jgi:hypothetical protein